MITVGDKMTPTATVRLLLTILVASTIWSTALHGANRYVSKAGSNTSPYDTWAKAATHPNRLNGVTAAGDSVIFGAGVFDTCYIQPPTGGTAKTVYYGDSTASNRGNTVISGGWGLSGSWSVRTGSIYAYQATIPQRWNYWDAAGHDWMAVSEDGRVLQMTNSLANVSAAGRAFYDWTTDSLYVWTRESDSPGSHTIRVAQTCAVLFTSASQDSITFDRLTFDLGATGVIVLSSSNSTGMPDAGEIKNCNIRNGAIGMSAQNQCLVYGGTQGINTTADLGTGWRFINDTLQYCTGDLSALSEHSGAGIDLYGFDAVKCSALVIMDLGGTGINFKNGFPADVPVANCVIMDCKITGGYYGMRIGPHTDSMIVAGCQFINQTQRGLTVFSSSGTPAAYKRIKIFNNTFYNIPDPILIAPTVADAGSGCEVRYNSIFDTTSMVRSINFDVIGGEAPSQNPFIETYWDVDSNMYYGGATAFTCKFSDNNTTCTGTNWTAWQGCGFDVRGLNTTNPNFSASQTPVLTRPFASNEMNRTYLGRTWTIYGAVQPNLAITDTCIAITGKTTMAYSDTCYCIVDSLLYNFTQRDTLINTGGHDNIRIWGYKTGGGRGIIGYSADDAGNLSWATDSAKSAVVLFMNNSDNVRVSNLAIVPRVIDDSVRQIVTMNALTVRGLLVENCSTRTAGFSSRAFQSWTTGGGSSMNLDLYNSYFGTASKGYNRRDQMYGATIAVEAGLKTDALYQYMVKVHGCRIQTIHTGIGVTGATKYPVFYLDSNTISVDTRNDLYMTYDDNDVNNSAGDPFGINVDGVDSLSRITGNTITSGTSYYGGDGMLLQHINASATNQFEVYNNTLNLSHGAHPRIAAGRQAVLGFYIRNYDASLFVKGLHLYNNLGYLRVDEDGATNYAGIYGECVRAGFENGANGNVIENNHFSLVPRDSLTRTGAGTLEVSGLTFEQHDSTNSAGDAGTGNNVARYNYWRVPRNPIWLGGTRIGIGADNVMIIGDTCNTLYDGDSTFVRFHQSGTYYSHSINNNLQDMVLQGYANVSDVIKGTVTASPDQFGKQLSYLRSVTVNLKDVSSANVAGGTIWAKDAYGHQFNMPTTNGSGNSSDTLRWRFFGYDALPADGYVVADSNAYNNFTFWGKSGSDSASTSATINWTTSQLINVQLTGAAPSVYQIFKGTIISGAVIK